MKKFNENNFELYRQAQLQYWAGYRITQIAQQLAIPVSTIASWKKRDKWDELSPVDRVEVTLESRLNLLILKEDKSGSDYKEIDLLGRQLERTARIKKYSRGGNEADLNPNVQNRNKGPRTPKAKNPITEEQQKLLVEGFLKGMFPYQRHWHEMGHLHRIRNILKSRQIGATYYFAHEAFIDALTTGRNQIFLSASKKQALQFRSYIVSYAQRVADVSLKGETILLPNGAELIFLGTNKATAQSYHGNLYFDEYFWVPNFDIMRKVASGMASQKQYRQTYFSTPTSMASMAYPFWSGKRYNERLRKSDRVDFDISHGNLKNGLVFPDSHWRQIVTIYDAEQGGCDLFDIAQLKLENSLSEFEQLYLCQFADDTLSVFNFTALQRCFVDTLDEWSDYRPFAMRPFGERPVWIGYDPSNTGDRAALAIIAPPRVDGGKFRVLHVETFHGLDYEVQAKKIKHYCDSYNVVRLNIDASGLGSAVFQLVRKFYPAARGITYNVEIKNEMVLKTLNIVEKSRLEFDSGSKEIVSSFLSIKKQLTKSGQAMTYHADRSEEASHGDIAWAIMHTLINEPYGGKNAQSQSFIEVL